MLTLRTAVPSDRSAVWRILAPVLGAGETLALPREWNAEQALEYWFGPQNWVFVAEEQGGQVVGTFYVRANQLGGGKHIANCGYVTEPQFRGRGVATMMGLHSFDIARSLGFRAMQFNFVIHTNEIAVTLWQKLGFQIIGTSPDAFELPTGALADALIMYRRL